MRLIKIYLENTRGIRIGFLESEGKHFFLDPDSGIIYKLENQKLIGSGAGPQKYVKNALEAFHISQIRGGDYQPAFFPGPQCQVDFDYILLATQRLEIPEPPTEKPHIPAPIVDNCTGDGEGTPISLPQITHSEDRPEGTPDFEGDEVKHQESPKKKTKGDGNKPKNRR